MLFHRDLERNMRVCQHCGHHLRLAAKQRLAMLFDEGVYTAIELPEAVADPLKFRDSKRYTERIKEARSKTGTADALTVAHGTIGGIDAVVMVQDFEFMGGSMGVAVGEAVLSAARLAVAQRAPLVAVVSSGGARMQEGILSLMQMTRTTIAIDEVREAGLPYITILTDPTMAGVTASFAMLGDIAIAEPGALIGFTGGRVIEQTIREKLPEGFQRSEYQLDHGMVDMVVPRGELRDTLVRVLGLLTDPAPRLKAPPAAAEPAAQAVPKQDGPDEPPS
jgi:acetyl-CoA carboxylase carboxyl transferase subunit beta